MKRSGLGRDPLSWIKSTVQEKKEIRVQPEGRKRAVNPEIPKFKTFEIKLTVLLREDQLEFLDRILRGVNKSRDSDHRKERITKNTIIRACIDAFKDAALDLENVPDEDILLARMKEKVRK